MITKENLDDKLKDCFMGGIPMKKFIFDLQLFAEGDKSVVFEYDATTGVVTGYTETETSGGKDKSEAQFTIEGLTGKTGLTGEINGKNYTVKVTDDTVLKKDKDVQVIIAKVDSGDNTYDLSYNGAKTDQAATSAWSITGKIGKYTKAEYYEVPASGTDAGKIVYHAPQDLVQITLDKTDITAENLKDYLDVDSSAHTITVQSKKTGDPGSEVITNLEAGFTVDAVNTDNYTIAFAKDDTVVKNPEIQNPKLHLYNATQGKVQVKGDWSEGYYLVEDANKKNTTIKYSAAKTDQVLANITGLKKGTLTDKNDPTDATKIIGVNGLTLTADGKITLTKDVLSTYDIKIENLKAPDGETANTYTIALASDAGIKKAKEETVDETTTFTAPDKEDIWELKNTTATYKKVIPAYYTEKSDIEITYTPQSDTQIFGVIKGLNINPDKGDATSAELKVYEDKTKEAGKQSTIGVVTTKAGDPDVVTSTPGITMATTTEGEKTIYTFTVNKNVMPTTTGKITVSENPNAKLKLGDDATAQTVETSAAVAASGTPGESDYVAAKPASPSWTVSAGTATLTANLKNGYVLSEDEKTIQSYAAQDNATLATITGLKADLTAWSDTLGTIEGGTHLAGADGSDDNKTITITLKPAALTNKNVTIKSSNDSFKYELALASDVPSTTDDTSKDGDQAGTSAGTEPDAINIWVVSGTTAVYKQVIPEYWTLDGGKIVHHKQADTGTTYATLKGLKSGVYVNDAGKLGFDVEFGTSPNTATQFVEAVTLGTDNEIKLNALALGTSNVTLVNGNAKDGDDLITYKLAIDTTSGLESLTGTTEGGDPIAGTAVRAVQTPNTTYKWWEVASGGTATLHHATQEGFKVENDGLLIKHYAAVADSTIATITGLSNSVKALDKDGAELGQNADEKTAVQLGIAAVAAGQGTAAKAAVIAHNTVVEYNDPADLTKGVKTWNEGGAGEGEDKQVITLTNAMLNKGKVALKDNNLKDGDAFELVLSDDGKDDPATVAEPSNKWAVAGTADATTLTYQSYEKGYYKLDSATKAAITYTKDTSPTKLFVISVNKAQTVAPELAATATATEKKYSFADDNPAVLKFDGKAFVTVNDDKTITINKDAASTTDDNNFVFKSDDKVYKDYVFTDVEKNDQTSKMVTWGTPTWALDSTTATLSKKPESGKEGYELSSDGKTLTYRNSSAKNLLTLSGLKSGSTLDTTTIAYDDDEKTVTILSPNILTNTKVTLKSADKEDYTLAVDETEIRTKGEDGYSWTPVTTAGTITVKSVKRDFYTVSGDTILYNKEVPKETLFTLSGLNAEAIPTTFTDTDGDNALNAIEVKDGDNVVYAAGTEFLTFTPAKDGKGGTVSIENAAVLPKTLDTTTPPTPGSVTLKGNGWKFDSDSITEPTFNVSGGSWSVVNGDVVLTVPTTTEGYKLTDEGQKLTYITGDQTFLTISGLNVPTGDATEWLKNLKDAFDGEIVTLPQSVLGTASKIKLTPGNNFENDGFKLALGDDVLQTANTGGYSWTVTDGDNSTKNVTFKSLTREYWTPDNADNTTSYTYHKAANAQTLFTLNGLNDTARELITGAYATDKDADQILTNGTTDLITVYTETGKHKIVLDSSIMPTGDGDKGRKVTLKSNDYTFATDTDLSTPVYGNGAWTPVNANGVSTLQFEATTAGYVIEDKTITYVPYQDSSGDAHKYDFLQVSGLKIKNADNSAVTPDLNTTAVFDDTEGTVTLTKDVLNDAKVSIKALDGNTYTLKLDSEVLQEAKDGYSWTVESSTMPTSGEETTTVVAKAVTQAYYASDTSNTFFTYKKEVPDHTLFTLTGVKATDAIKALNTTADKDGDNILGTDLISFNANSEITIVSSVLPETTNNATVTIDSKSAYKFADDVTAPVYVDSEAEWTKNTAEGHKDEATLSILPQSAGWSLSNNDKTLTRVTKDERNLVTLSGLTEAITAGQLKDAISVSIDDKTLTLSKSVLKGISKITADKTSGYKLAIDDSDVQVGIKYKTGSTTEKAEEDVWQFGESKDGVKTAYRRTVNPEYYTIDNAAADTITYHSAVKKADLFGISGLKDSLKLNDDGDIVADGGTSVVSMYKDSADATMTVVSISSEALPDGTTSFTGSGSSKYKFDLASGAATLGNRTWTYNKTDGTITVKGTYTEGFILADDGKSIKKVAAGAQTLATITGLKKEVAGFTTGEKVNGTDLTDATASTAIAKLFEFDADTKTITFKDDTFFPTTANGTVKIEDTGNFFNYKLALDSEINTNKTKAGTKWDITADGVIKYQNITEAAYTTAADGKSIAVQAAKTGTAATAITGLKIDGYTKADGTEVNTLSFEKNTDKTKVEDAISVDTAKKTVTVKKDFLPNATNATGGEKVTATSGYKLVLDPSDDSIPTEVTYSNYKLNQVADATSFTVKATAGAYYSGSDTATVTYIGEASTVLATISGVKPSAAINDADIPGASTSVTGSNGIYVDTDEKTITLDDDALVKGSDVSITTTQGYKLALYDEQDTTPVDLWTFDNSTGTAVFKKATPQYFKVENGTKIKSIASKDNEIYFTITGLKKTTDDAADKLTVKQTATGDYYIGTGTSTTPIVNFDGNDTVTLALAALPTAYDEKTVITIKKGKDGTANYKLALDEKMLASSNIEYYTEEEEKADETGKIKKDDVKSITMGKAAERDKELQNSGTKIVYAAPIAPGYILSDTGDKITVANGKGKKEYFSITGLKTNIADDDIEDYVTVDTNTNTVTIQKDALDGKKVTISNSTDDTYSLALDDDVQTTHDADNYITFSNGTLTLKSGEPAYYSINAKGEIEHHNAGRANPLATITGFKSTLTEDTIKSKIQIDWDTKEITISDNTVLGESNIAIGTGRNDYSLKFTNVTDTKGANNTWKVKNGTATLVTTPGNATYTLSEDKKSIVYTGTDKETELLKITGLKSTTEAQDGAGTGNEGITTTNYIEGISVAKTPKSGEETKDTLTVTLNDGDLLANKNISITGSSDYTAKLALGGTGDTKIPTSSAGKNDWDYTKSGTGDNATYTAAFKKTVPEYYELDTTSTTAKYHASTNNTVYASISGKDFNTTIEGKIDAYLGATDDDAKDAKDAVYEELKNYVTLTEPKAADGDNPATPGKIKIIADDTTTKTYLIAGAGKSLTISTPKVNGEAYEVEIEDADAVKPNGTNKWSISGNSLILSNGFTAGYKLNGTKLSYEDADTTGGKLFTINGLDLTDAKAAMVITDSQKTTVANAALNAIKADDSLALTAEEKTALTKAPEKPTDSSAADYEKNLKIYNAYTAALEKEEAAQKATNLKTYIENNLTVANATGEDAETYAKTVTINDALLGTANVTITKNGTDAYKLVCGNDVTASAPTSSANAWSFSGGTATYRMTTPKYYLYDETKNQILYKKPVEGAIATQVKGLATTKKEYRQGTASTGTEDTSVTGQTTTTTTQTFYTDTTVVQVGTPKDGDEEVIGTVTTTNSHVLTKKVTKYADTTKADTVETSTSATTTTVGDFVKGLDLTAKTVTLSKNVLGTSAVSITNDYTLDVDSGVTEPAQSGDTWTGTPGGTSTVLKANISEGYTLSTDNKKITYSAAKNNVALLTISGIKIPTIAEGKLKNGETAINVQSSADEKATAIDAWVSSKITKGTEVDGITPLTISNDALNERAVTKSGTTAASYKLLAKEGNAPDAAPHDADDANGWNGWNYQSFKSGYYAELENGTIKYNPKDKVTTIATVKGLKGTYNKAMGEGDILTIDAAHLGTANVSVTGSAANDITFKLADDVVKSAKSGDKWVINGTSATKKDGDSAYYDLEGTNVIKYIKETNVTKTYATITGLKAGVTELTDNNGTVKLDSDALGTAKVTIANGKNAGTTNYKLSLDTTTEGKKVSTPKVTAASDGAWTVKGVNTTLKGSVTAGWALSADEKSAMYTAEVTDKAIATFTFATTDTIKQTLADKVLTLSEVGENNKITVKTNPYALTVNVTDADFKGKSSDTRVTLVGSASADIFDISANEYIAVSGGTGDDVVLLGTAKKGVSIGGGAGNDSIHGTGDTDLIILGEAGNDTINITGNAQNVNGGAGDDNISVANAVQVLGDAGNDTINVTGTVSNTISGGIGNDSIMVASAGAIEIKGDAGNDYIEITDKANGTTIYGGANDDTINVVGASSASVSVLGDAGNDVIEFKGEGTIYGGAGNDSIDVSNGEVTFFYANGDGSDSVNGWSANDKFVLKSGTIADKKASIGGANNADLILTIGSGKVTLFGAASTVNDKQWTYYSTDTSSANAHSIVVLGGDTAAEAGDIASDINSLIYEDNNLVTPNDISDLVSTNSVTEYHVGNYNLTTPDQILPDSDNISYGNQQKKNNK